MADKVLKIIFAGTPAFGLPALQAISASRHQVIGVYTQPDKPAGRGLELKYSPIKEWGLMKHIPIFQPEHFKEEANIRELSALKPDLMIVIAYGLILPQAVLDIPPLGCVNVHASLLPSYRGASPIQQAILAGDQESGVTIMAMDSGMDTGPILKTKACDLDDNETSASLHDKLSMLALEPLMDVIDALAEGSIEPMPQNNSLATYAPKIKKEAALIDWTKEASVLERQVRAYKPWPIAYTFADGQLIRIHEAFVEEQTSKHQPGIILAIDKKGVLVATGQGTLRITRLQFSGTKVLAVSDWVNSNAAKNLMNAILQ